MIGLFEIWRGAAIECRPQGTLTEGRWTIGLLFWCCPRCFLPVRATFRLPARHLMTLRLAANLAVAGFPFGADWQIFPLVDAQWGWDL